MNNIKCNIGRLSAIFCLWDISSKCSTLISQHSENPLALEPLFRGGNVLMKSLPVLMATPRFSGEKSK